MTDIADEIYEATGIIFGATQLAAMAQFIRTREDAARQQGRIEGAAVGAEDLAAARREAIKAAADLAECDYLTPPDSAGRQYVIRHGDPGIADAIRSLLTEGER